MNLDRNTKFSSNLNFLSSMFSPHSNYIICYKEKAGIPQSRKALRAPAPSCYVTLLSVAQQAVPLSLGGDKHESIYINIDYLTSFDSRNQQEIIYPRAP